MDVENPTTEVYAQTKVWSHRITWNKPLKFESLPVRGVNYIHDWNFYQKINLKYSKELKYNKNGK